MESLYLLIPLSIVLVFVIGAFFWWSVKNGQFDDLEGPAYRILMDDDNPAPPSQENDHTESDTENVTKFTTSSDDNKNT